MRTNLGPWHRADDTCAMGKIPVFHVWDRVETTPIPTMYSRYVEGCPMPDTYLNGRPVYFGGMEFDGVDSYISDACYADTLQDLDDHDILELNEQEKDYICEQILEHYGYWPD
jgi:hypothetical protein